MGAAQKVAFCFKHPLQKSHLSEFFGCFTKIPFEHSDKNTNMEYSHAVWIMNPCMQMNEVLDYIFLTESIITIYYSIRRIFEDLDYLNTSISKWPLHNICISVISTSIVK